MKHMRIKRPGSASATHSAAWLVSASATLILVLSPLFTTIFSGRAAAVTAPANAGTGVTPSWTSPGGGATITATFIDSSHIAVSASGIDTFTDSSGTESVDFSGLQGIYYRGDTSVFRDSTGDNVSITGNPAYTFQNNKSSTCNSHNSQIFVNNNYAPGNAQIQFDAWLPAATGSSSQIGQCEAVPPGTSAGSNTTITLTTTYDPAVALGNDVVAHVGGKANPVTSSTVMFYEDGAGDIDATTVDPSLGTGNDGKYIFKQEAGTQTFQQSSSGNSIDFLSRDGSCNIPDTITLTTQTATSDSGITYVEGNYKTCNGSYTVAILGSTPESAVSASNLGAGGSATSASADPTLQCTASGPLLSSLINFVMCPLISLMWSASQTLDGWISQQLQVDVGKMFDTASCKGSTNCQALAFYQAWNAFRIIATAILVIGGLLAILSQALGFEMLDAYTIRKVLPRLLIATIGISLSWPIMRLIIDFFNALGLGIVGIMYAPFAHVAGGVSAGTSALAGLGLGVGILALGFVSLTFLLSLALALLMLYLVLLVRQVVIIILVITAPVAIACYILPNTHKVWKLWYDGFLGLLVAYPLAQMIIAAGHIFSAITQAGN